MKKRKYKLNFKTIARNILILLITYFLITTTIDFCKYPEKYITTWRYQLQQDIKNGDVEAIAYYNNNYLKNNVKLFD